MSGKTAIDRLCELLDENDEYYSRFGNRVWWGRPIDAQTGEPINVFHNIAEPAGGDRLRVELQLATPEQAVAATVGTDTCRLKKGETAWFADYNGYVTEWTCDECGGPTFYDAEMRPRFCADCRRKVVEWTR